MFLRAASVAFVALQLSYSVLATLTQLDDLDSRITWTPQAKQPGAACRGKPANNVCTGFWWPEAMGNYHAGEAAQTWGPDTSMSFNFTGSSFMIFGLKFWAGADGVVTIDGRDAGTFSTTADGVMEALPQQLLFMQGDLDATQQHTVVVTYDQRSFGSTGDTRRWLGIDYIVVDERVQGLSPSQSNDHNPTSSKMSGTTLGLVIALPLLGGLALGLLVILILLLRRRRIHSHPHSHSHPYPQPHPQQHPLPSDVSELSESRRPSDMTQSSYLTRVPSTIQTKFVHVLPPPMSSAHSPSEVASTHFGASEPVPYLLNPKAVVDSVSVTRPSEKAAVLGLQPPLYQRVKEKD